MFSNFFIYQLYQFDVRKEKEYLMKKNIKNIASMRYDD